MPTPMTSLYAVERPGQPVAVMICVAGFDPMGEAKRGGAVTSVRPITPAEADAIKSRRPASEGAPAQIIHEPADLTGLHRLIQELAVSVETLRIANAKLRFEMDAIIAAEIKEQRIVA